MRKLSWLLYIVGKERLLNSQDNIFELAYMLYAAIYWTLILASGDIQSTLLDQLIQQAQRGDEEMKEEEETK